MAFCSNGEKGYPVARRRKKESQASSGEMKGTSDGREADGTDTHADIYIC